ncbi:MAG TPA: beta-ketoacyl synthase N-terminal-like domain-containing protein, partial [Candidatus Limnocylindrales bacterium]|nr:beta-ketoacyl synthase N-terminal-like domain-containing protein [Candidatus Limnocylindrales bacterium]
MTGGERSSRAGADDGRRGSMAASTGWSWPRAPRRVVVTGMGMLTALGNDVQSSWDGLVAGRSG